MRIGTMRRALFQTQLPYLGIYVGSGAGDILF
jgi:hypothetical protein